MMLAVATLALIALPLTLALLALSLLALSLLVLLTLSRPLPLLLRLRPLPLVRALVRTRLAVVARRPTTPWSSLPRASLRLVDDGLEALRALPDEAGVDVVEVDDGVEVDGGLEALRAPPGEAGVEPACVRCFG